jgi:hypothetical protein
MNNDTVQTGLGIVSDLLNDGVPEWTDSSVFTDADWEYVDPLRVENEFVTNALTHIEGEQARGILVNLLVKSAVDTLDSLAAAWSEEDLAEVPSLAESLQAGRVWLAKHSMFHEEEA